MNHRNLICNKNFLNFEEYKPFLQKLIDKNAIILLMICNDIAIRINHIEILCKLYSDILEHYKTLSKENKIKYSAKIIDFIVVEDIVYHSRRVIDQIIYALWINKVGVQNTENVAHPIDSIGKYLNQADGQKIVSELDCFKPFLKDLNNISNSYKHSINSFSQIGTDLDINSKEPSFHSYVFKPNDADVKIDQIELTKNIKLIFMHFLNCL